MSSKNKRLVLLGVVVGLAIAAFVFYGIQNAGSIPGGSIALPKLFWLALIVTFWYVAPVFFIYHRDVNATARMIIYLHLANVIVRAVVELYMMYVSENWHPYYGIAHDIVSAVLIGSLILLRLNRLSPHLKSFLAVLCGTFIIEACFASYMVTQVAAEGSVVFFVPDSEEYQLILRVTWVAVVGLLLGLMYFGKAWLDNND